MKAMAIIIIDMMNIMPCILEFHSNIKNNYKDKATQLDNSLKIENWIGTKF